MSIIESIKSAAGDVAEAVEHPFLTIGARLASIRDRLEAAFGHPYVAPLQGALSDLHGVVSDLAQEVAELRVPCPCKAAPTSATAGAGDPAPTFKDRAKAEADDLLQKRTALGAFIASAAFDAVPATEQQRLNAQAEAMTAYQVALQARIDADFGA